ncbi:MAG: hypothetical protein QW341_01830 [Candidatus Bathyarchaeia archaeon]
MMKPASRLKRTSIFIVDEKLWAWAHYRARALGFKSVADYIFELIRRDKVEAEKKA